MQFSPGKPLSSGFSKILISDPDRKAIFYKRYFTYSETGKRVSSIAENLPRGCRIAVFGKASFETYCSILAVSISGGSFVPVSPLFPFERNRKVIHDSGCAVMIVEDKNAIDPQYLQIHGLIILDLKNLDPSENFRFPPEQNDPEREAYLIFTSGSTGDPKGVPVKRKNAWHYFNFFGEEFSFNSSDKFLQPYDLSFDASLRWIFMPFNCGGCVYIPSGEKGPMESFSMISDHEITVVMFVPSMVRNVERYLSGAEFPSVRYSFFGGESLRGTLLKRWMKTVPNAVIENFYGPTEATMSCTHYRINPKEMNYPADTVPIGKPNSGMNVKIISSGNGTGELLVSGPQVIDHYLHEQQEGFSVTDGKNWYHTGDLVFYDRNGDLNFAGRNDHQFKIHGYRVEPGEIENAIRKITAAEAVCINEGNKITAYVSSVSDEEQIIESLKEILPWYMIPSEFNFIPEFPLLPSGKIDRKALLKND